MTCTEQNKAGKGTQCWEEGILDDSVQYKIISKLDGRVVQMDAATRIIKMMTRDDSIEEQKWMIKINADGVSGQFVNVGSTKVLSVRGISDFTHNTPDDQGYFNIIGNGGIEYSPGNPAAWDRGLAKKDGVRVNVGNQTNGKWKQLFKLEPIDSQAQSQN